MAGEAAEQPAIGSVDAVGGEESGSSAHWRASSCGSLGGESGQHYLGAWVWKDNRVGGAVRAPASQRPRRSPRSSRTQLHSLSRGRAAISHHRPGGRRAAELPNLVTTFDDFHVRVLHHLLDLGLATWPGGHRRLDVMDDFRGIDSDYRWLLTGSYRRYAGCGADGVITSLSERISKPTFGFGKKGPHLAVLGGGTSSHDDVRRALRTVFKNVPGSQAAVVAWLAANYRHVVVDEIYDADELDIFICMCLADTTTATLTLVGDPWQALYDWRGATPEKVGEYLLDESPIHAIRTAPVFSLRHRADHRTRAGSARGGGRCAAASRQHSDRRRARQELGNVVDGRLQRASARVPHRGQPRRRGTEPAPRRGDSREARSEVLRQAVRAGPPRSAGRGHRADLARALPSHPHWELVAGLLAVDALERVRDAAEAVSPKSRPSKLKASAEVQRVQEVDRLRRRLTRADLIPGLTVHQAKGCEWPRVGVALTAAHETALATGLTNAQAEHCVVYVALTRAKNLCGSLAHEDALDLGADD